MTDRGKCVLGRGASVSLLLNLTFERDAIYRNGVHNLSDGAENHGEITHFDVWKCSTARDALQH